jgi:hypothetical protein
VKWRYEIRIQHGVPAAAERAGTGRIKAIFRSARREPADVVDGFDPAVVPRLGVTTMESYQMAEEPDELAAALERAASDAGRAPSILNTQPWRWRVYADAVELHADRSRQVFSIDPDGRMLTISCGAALHHLRVALLGLGWQPEVDELPDPTNPDLLARVAVSGKHPVRPVDTSARRSIFDRRTERRPFTATTPIRPDALSTLDAAASATGADLYRVGPDQMPFLVSATATAQEIQASDEAYLADLARWTHRPYDSQDGVPATTYVAPVPRPVPLRDFSHRAEIHLDPGFGDDRSAEYLIVATDSDKPTDWLTAGAGLSAAWLSATRLGLAASVLTDVVEVPASRTVLNELMPGHRFAQIVFRVGPGMPAAPHTPRRSASDILDNGQADG